MGHKIRFAILGFGHIGKRYASILMNHGEAELIAIADLTIHNQPDFPSSVLKFTSIDELLSKDLAIDVIIIATPNGLHNEHAIACLEKGIHVIVEKPIALSVNDAEQLFRTAEANNKKVFPVFQNRLSPTSIWLKEILERKELGEIFMVQVNCFWNRDQRYYLPDSWHGSKLMDGGTLFTQFSHFIDTLHWLFGDLKNIKANLSKCADRPNVEFEDTGVVIFDLENHGTGSFQFTTAVWDKNLESTITIISENGTIKIGGQYMDEVLYTHTKHPASLPVKNNYSNHQLLVDDVIYRLNNNLPAMIDSREVVAVIDIIEQIYSFQGNNKHEF